MGTYLRALETPQAVEIPLYECRVPAGFPSPADDYLEAPLDLNAHLIRRPAATFFVRIEGDSMLGAGIYPGDLAIVDRSIDPKDGHIIIAVLNGELTIKRLRTRQEKVYLQAESTEYADIEVAPEMDFEVWGVVRHVIHSYIQ